MANQKEIESTYDYMDRIFRRIIGDHGDITGAMYNGDFSISLEEAQRRKHAYILNGIGFKNGDRVLDIGCGWGPMLEALKAAGGVGVGLTISPVQANGCRTNRLHAELMDWKDVDPIILGKFDGIVSVGAFEAFCGVDELLANHQEDIYMNFFRLCNQCTERKEKALFANNDLGQDGKWLIQPNELHHRKPTAFLTKNWWQSSYDAVIIGFIILVIAFIFKHLSWELILFIGFSISACQIHKYAHIPPGRLPAVVRFLQKYKIIQDCSHHMKHHMEGKHTNYCLISPFLNPVLGKIQFWHFMEFILRPVLGEQRK